MDRYWGRRRGHIVALLSGTGRQECLWSQMDVIGSSPSILAGNPGFFMRFANKTMKAESIFLFYMALTSVLLIPVAWMMTDFTRDINCGFKGPYLAGMIQILNAIGALCLVHAFRYGKAIFVAPMITALSPVITVVLSFAIYAVSYPCSTADGKGRTNIHKIKF